MRSETQWDSLENESWLRAFSLPTLPWTKSFLVLSGLPNSLLENLNEWNSIYTQGIARYESQRQAKNWASIEYEGIGELLKQTVTEMLQSLVAQVGRNTAIELEKWVQLNFFCWDYELAMGDWAIALRFAFPDQNSRRQREDDPPVVLSSSLLLKISELVSLERRKEIYASLRAVAPPPPEEDCLEERLDQCYEVTLLNRVIKQSLTRKALHLIESELDKVEQSQVIDWAETQMRIRKIYRGANAEGYLQKYLQAELLCSNKPSLLDF